MKQTRPVWCIAGAAVAVVLGASSYAFACSASAYLGPLSPNAGPRGTEVTVTGSRWSASAGENRIAGPVEIRWGDQYGPVLATATGESFSVKVIIPDADPGYQLITAVAHDSAGKTVGRQAQAFRVTSGGPTAAPVGGAPSGDTSTTGDASTTPQGSNATTAGDPALASDPAAGDASAGNPALGTGGPSAPTQPTSAAAAASAASGSSQSLSESSSQSSGPPPPPPSRSDPPNGPPPPPAGPPQPGNPSFTGAPGAPALASVAAATGSPLDHAGADAVASHMAPLPDAAAVWGGRDEASERPSLASSPSGDHRLSGERAAATLSVSLLVVFASALVVTVRRRRSTVSASATRH